eukprot:5401014-Lingulodinium_polyedra.AAC.1
MAVAAGVAEVDAGGELDDPARGLREAVFLEGFDQLLSRHHCGTGGTGPLSCCSLEALEHLLILGHVHVAAALFRPPLVPGGDLAFVVDEGRGLGEERLGT